jgi:hypothetical protein
MSRKNVLLKKQIITAGDLSQATVASSVIGIKYLDNVSIQCNLTGAPVGSLAIQTSTDHDEDDKGNVLAAGNFVSYTSASISASGNVVFDLNQVAAPFVKILYTKSSGTGAINAFVFGKMV